MVKVVESDAPHNQTTLMTFVKSRSSCALNDPNNVHNKTDISGNGSPHQVLQVVLVPTIHTLEMDLQLRLVVICMEDLTSQVLLLKKTTG